MIKLFAIGAYSVLNFCKGSKERCIYPKQNKNSFEWWF